MRVRALRKGWGNSCDNMKEGFHIIERKSIKENDLPIFKKISIIRWIQNTRNKNFEKYEDYTVIGFERVLSEAENQKEMAKYLRNLLVENANYLVSTGSTFQFLIEGSIEMWKRPVVKSKSGETINLASVFGSLDRKGVNWFYQELNVQS